MPINKEDILQLSLEERRQLAFELLDSIDEEYIDKPLPEWKKQLIKERIDIDKNNPGNTTAWSELRKKYFNS